MNKNYFLISMLCWFFACAQTPPGPYREIAWVHPNSWKTPESVYYDQKSDVLFISNINGKPDQKDGNGWITKVTTNGIREHEKWIEGLNAPKGMRVQGNTLWVSDIDQLVAIDITQGKIKQRYTAPEAKFLNDVAIDFKGRVYVSDTLGSRIYRLENEKLQIWIEGEHLQSPNGLFYKNGKLFVAAWGLTSDWSTKQAGGLYSIHLETKEIDHIAKHVGNLDGLEIDDKGRFLVSDWVSGKIFAVQSSGAVEQLHTFKQGSADFGYISGKEYLVVPEMLEDRITALKL